MHLADELKDIGCELLCWNWNRAAAGVICRLDETKRRLFKDAVDLEALIAEHRGQLPVNYAFENSAYFLQ